MAERSGSRLCLLGPWTLWLQGKSVPASVTADGRRLLALLAMQGSLGRGEIRDRLWPDAGHHAAASRLRTTLWRLAPIRDEVMAESAGALHLRPDLTVDVAELMSAAAAVGDGVRGTDPRRFDADLLPGWDEDWLVVERERIRQVRLHALEQLSAQQLAEGRFSAALDSALVALRADPLRESAHRAVIAVHLAEDNLSEAMAQFLRCCDILRLELGVPPSRKLRELMTGAPAQFAGEK